MTEHRNEQWKSETDSDGGKPRSFTPENRRKNGALFRQIRERIKEGYYESGQVLKVIADRITGGR